MSRWKETASQTPRLFDPYYDWSRATNFSYYGRSDWLPLLLELNEGTDVVSFSERVFRMRGQGWSRLVRIPPLYRQKPERLAQPSRFMSVFAKPQFVDLLYADEGPSHEIAQFQLGRSVAFEDKKMSGFGASGPKLKLPPAAVVIGVIDDDIAFAHERFRDGARSTRVHYFWDQLEPHSPSATFYGREIYKHDVGAVPGIDSRLAACRPGPLVDEDELYRSYGYLDHSNPGHKFYARRAAHGTHVMDLAANPQAEGIGPLIAVQLPAATTADTSGGSLAPQVIDAIWYMLYRADDIASASGVARLPLVINLSYGTLAGPHDRSGVLERAIDEILQLANANYDRALRFVLPAGNSFLSRCHAHLELGAKAHRNLHWRLQPEHRAESFLEIYYPANRALQVAVTAPNGTATIAFGVGTTYEWEASAALTSGLVSFYSPYPGSNRRFIRISLAPTAWPDGALTLAPAGLWTIRLENPGNAPVKDIDAWIQRADSAPGYPRHRRQSYFDDPAYARFDHGGRAIEDDAHPFTASSYVKRRGSLSALATGKRTVVVGGFRRSDWKAAPYSSSGPASGPRRGPPCPDGPDIAAVCDDSPSHHGLLAAGSRSGSCVAMRGTSVSAPQITRWIAGDLMAGGAGRRLEVANAAVAAVPPGDYNETNPPPGLAVPAIPMERRGKGRLDRATLRRRRSDR